MKALKVPERAPDANSELCSYLHGPVEQARQYYETGASRGENDFAEMTDIRHEERLGRPPLIAEAMHTGVLPELFQLHEGQIPTRGVLLNHYYGAMIGER